MSLDFFMVKRDEVDFTDEEIDELIEGGYVCYQKIDGEVYLKFFPSFFNDGSELAKKDPEFFCLNLWNTLCIDTKGKLDMVSFIVAFCSLHRVVKDVTDSSVDFCETVGRILTGEAW